MQKSAYGETACRKSVWSEKRSARACGSPAAAVADNNPDITHLDAPLRRSLLLLLLVASVARPWLLSRSLSLCYISAFCGPLFVVWEFDTFFSTYLHGLRRRSFFFTWGKLHSISRPLQWLIWNENWVRCSIFPCAGLLGGSQYPHPQAQEL